MTTPDPAKQAAEIQRWNFVGNCVVNDVSGACFVPGKLVRSDDGVFMLYEHHLAALTSARAAWEAEHRERVKGRAEDGIRDMLRYIENMGGLSLSQGVRDYEIRHELVPLFLEAFTQPEN